MALGDDTASGFGARGARCHQVLPNARCLQCSAASTRSCCVARGRAVSLRIGGSGKGNVACQRRREATSDIRSTDADWPQISARRQTVWCRRLATRSDVWYWIVGRRQMKPESAGIASLLGSPFPIRHRKTTTYVLWYYHCQSQTKPLAMRILSESEPTDSIRRALLEQTACRDSGVGRASAGSELIYWIGCRTAARCAVPWAGSCQSARYHGPAAAGQRGTMGRQLPVSAVPWAGSCQSARYHGPAAASQRGTMGRQLPVSAVPWAGSCQSARHGMSAHNHCHQSRELMCSVDPSITCVQTTPPFTRHELQKYAGKNASGDSRNLNALVVKTFRGFVWWWVGSLEQGLTLGMVPRLMT